MLEYIEIGEVLYVSRKIEYVKRTIKKTYERYIGKSHDEKATLLDVAKFFNTPVEKSRIEDYAIKSFDEETPSLEIVDKKILFPM